MEPYKLPKAKTWHFIVIILFIVICFSTTITPSAFGQDTIIEDLRNEIKQLKKTINELNKRIKRLEQELGNLKTLLNLKVDSKETQRLAVDSNKEGWKNPSNWKKIRDGMSRMQVISILGKPTQTKILGSSFLTLFYQGEVSGSGYVSGNVKLSDDRVWQINEPVF